jgi:hypothetical protein
MLFTTTVDTEEEWDWASGWPTHNLSVSNIYSLPKFQELCRRYGVATTYFTNQAVFEDARARDVLLGLAREPRVEIGMHIHPWNTPPLNGSGPVTSRQTFLHNLPDEQILAKLATVHSTFVEHGLKPTSFRGGRYSSGGLIHQFLRDHGFLADASVVPYSRWDCEGAPDYRQRGLEPVRLPPRWPGDAPLWEIPLTRGFTRRPFGFWQRCYEGIAGSPLSKLRLIGIAERLGLVRKVWLNFEDPCRVHMLPFLAVLRRLQLPCICFTIHSSSLVAGKGGYTPTPAAEERLYAHIETVFQTLAGCPELRPATVTEVARHLEEHNHACTRT